MFEQIMSRDNREKVDEQEKVRVRKKIERKAKRNEKVERKIRGESDSGQMGVFKKWGAVKTESRNRIIRMRIFFSFQKVWSLYYCMSLSRSRIMRSFFTSVQTKMPTLIFVRDRIQLYLAKMAIFDKMTK